MMQKSVLREYQKLSAFDQVERGLLMQERHDRDLRESVMLGLAFQTSWVMENLHHKSCILPDPDIFTIHMKSSKFSSSKSHFTAATHFFLDFRFRLLYHSEKCPPPLKLQKFVMRSFQMKTFCHA